MQEKCSFGAVFSGVECIVYGANRLCRGCVRGAQVVSLREVVRLWRVEGNARRTTANTKRTDETEEHAIIGNVVINLLARSNTSNQFLS